MGEKPASANPATVASYGDKKQMESHLSPDGELASICVANSPPSSPSLQNKREQTEVDLNAKTQETEVHSESKITDTDEQKVQKSVADLKPTIESSFPEVLAHPVVETFTVTPTENPPQPEVSSQVKSSLIEVPLSVVKPLEDLTLDDGSDMQEGNVEDEQKMCRGFFFKVGCFYKELSPYYTKNT